MRILLAIVFTLMLGLINCHGFRKQNTIIEENKVVFKRAYSGDSVVIISKLRQSLNAHHGIFISKEYFESTQLLIDTILYSPDFKKLAVFVIVKNPTYRQIVPDRNSEWYYDANCFIGEKRDDTIDLLPIGPNFTNSTDIKELSSIIRKTCINRETTDYRGSFELKYTIGKPDFWDCSIWQMLKTIKN